MRRRRIVIAFALVVLLIGGAAIAVWRMTRIAPTWYEPPSVSDPQVAEFADRVEYNLVQQAQQIRPEDDRWTLRIRQQQINAWLATRLQKWVTRETGDVWPQQIGTPQVLFDDGAIDIAIPIHASATRYLVARLIPHIVNGSMHVELDRVALGRIGLPGEPLANLLRWIGESARQTLDFEAFSSIVEMIQQRKSIDPVFDLTDGRRVRVLDIHIEDGYVDLTAVTLRD